jgi:mitochondrial fission protein ELM1|tara:strand:+ start:18 stop:956 length:939 start_codon:yes stop_codon:yes gene_type:complete
MGKLKGLLLTEGMHGMISQVEGLAKALDIEFTHQKVELNSFWKMIPPNLTPISNLVFKNFDFQDFDIIISCGRKSVIPSIYLKRNSKKKVFNIHIQDPKVSLSNFDFIIAPEHDSISGKNVITSKGAIHYLTLEEIKNNHNYLEKKLKKNMDYLLLVLGGPNKYYDYDDQNLRKIFDKIKKISSSDNLQTIVIPSMRTPKRSINLADELLGKENLVITNIDKKAYLSGLSLAKYIVVTCDSTSMISEAAITGKPIYIADIPAKKNDQRFKMFRELFGKLNITKNLNEKLEIWNYKSLNETVRIAKEIKKQLS